MNFVVRWIVTAIAVGAAVWLVPGISTVGSEEISRPTSTFCTLPPERRKPVLKVLSFPITVITLGVFYLILNALMLELAAWAATGIFSSGIAIDGFGSAVFGSIVISIVSAIVNGILGNND